jgi:hypothetical protein
MRRTRLLAAAGLLGAAACANEIAYPTTENLTTIEITDAPFPYDSVARVDLYIVSIAVRLDPDTSPGATGWITVAEPNRRYDLIALANGVTDTLGGAIVPPGDYKAVRMAIDTDSSSITALTGQPLPVDWQSSAGRPTLYALVEYPIGVPETGAGIVIDFDVGRSFLCDAPCHSFVFSPVFRAVDRTATGAVSGEVRGDTLAEYPAPIGGVTVTVYSGDIAQPDGTWWVRATGRTDATGHFHIAYLPPGAYILRADAPRASPFTPGVRAYSVVAAGAVTTGQDIVLPRGGAPGITVTGVPPYLYVPDSIEIVAQLVDGGGTPIGGATYTWGNLDTAVANLYVSFAYPNVAVVRPKAVGTAHIRITADSATRDLSIPVLATPATGVSWVRVTPDSAVIAVNDSLIYTASARDSAGIALPGRTYTWSSSDTTIAAILALSPDGVYAVVRGLRAGTAVISASTGGKTGNAVVRVQ